MKSSELNGMVEYTVPPEPVPLSNEPSKNTTVHPYWVGTDEVEYLNEELQ